VNAIDTTGAGEIFYGAFVYGLVRERETKEILEFSCAAAAMNCMVSGARGGIAPLHEIADLRKRGGRSEFTYAAEALREAARAVGANS
jgi:sulfofructose kinase